MGYTTDFTGCFTLDRQLDPLHHEYLTKFANTRRMKRSHFALCGNDFLHVEVGLGVGTEGEYFVDGGGSHGQDREDSIVDYNSPPATQPGLWCQWVPTEDGNEIEWDGGEKFYDYVKWLEYLIAHFLNRWGYTLNGRVHWRCERTEEIGTIVVEDNVVTVLRGSHVVYEKESGPAEQDEDVSNEEVKDSLDETIDQLKELTVQEEELEEAIRKKLEELDRLEGEINEIQKVLDGVTEEKSKLEARLEKTYEKLKKVFGD